MKEELLRVLNNKLSSINSDIDALKELNKKIDEENEELSFIDSIVNLFNEENGEKNPLNFDKVVKDDFTRALDIAGDETKKLFSSNACNYDGLVYLISGIKNGVSISLTNEQLNGIEFLIQSLTDKKASKEAKIQEYDSEKTKYSISDLNELKTRKDKYEKVLSEIEKNEYIKDIDLLKEAITFSNLLPEQTIKVLAYVLEYNAELYKENKPAVSEETVVETPVEEPLEEDQDKTVEFHFNQIENDNLFDLPNITFDDNLGVNNEETSTEEPVAPAPVEEPIEEPLTPQVEEPSAVQEEYQEFNPVEENKEENNPVDFIPVEPKEEYNPIEPIDEMPVASSLEESVEEPVEEMPLPPVEEPVMTPPMEEPVEKTTETSEPPIDNDFKDVISEKEDYETREQQEEEKTSTRELHKIFSKYGIEENVVLNELIDGDVKVYQSILDALKDRGILDYFKKNKQLLIETLLYSSTSAIDKVLTIVKEDLSVDDEDYEITLKIVIKTIPSIFILEGGNYNNFIENVKLFKELEINLINLFDFSKEMFVADHETIAKNLEIVKKYDVNITYRDAKYFLLIPNIAEKMDYYVESVYEDKTKGEVFDGVNYIKDYALKLNVVTSETIKRLRYASLNGKKVFGSRPGSLSGEITNLRVHALDINDEYLNQFFNNEFSNITGDEVREYVKLIQNSSNVGDYSDELDKLSQYKNGLRYTIEGINISFNKVQRNYSVLRSYGIDSKKALHFAVCYNLVITKDEYNKLSLELDKIGGNV